MRLWLVGGVAALLLALAGWGWWQRDARLRAEADVGALRVDLAVAQAALAAAQEAGRVHRIYLDQARARDARWQAMLNDLATEEGNDAPLSPYLRSAAERLWE